MDPTNGENDHNLHFLLKCDHKSKFYFKAQILSKQSAVMKHTFPVQGGAFIYFRVFKRGRQSCDLFEEVETAVKCKTTNRQTEALQSIFLTLGNCK